MTVVVVGAGEQLAALRAARQLAGAGPWREALRCGVRGSMWLGNTRPRSSHC